MTNIRKDLARMGSALKKVKNPMPGSETETKSEYTTSPSTEQSNKVKSDFKNFMSSNKSFSSLKPVNLNLRGPNKNTVIGAGIGGLTLGTAGFLKTNAAVKDSKAMCDRLSKDCFGNPKEPPASIKKWHTQNVGKQALYSAGGALLGAGLGAAFGKATTRTGLRIGNFNLKIG